MPPFRRVIGLSLMADGYFIHWPLISPREAMTTAESPEPLTFQHADSIMNKQNHQEIVGPAARQCSCPSVSIRGS